MTQLRVAPAWRAALATALRSAPARPREPLRWRGHALGSIEPDLPARAGLQQLLRRDAEGWEVQGELTPAMEAIAQALRDAGLTGAWRDELLAVRNPAREVLGVVERAAARPLGLFTQAVHLLATDAQGRHWLQRRSLAKDSDPGLWDTLVGGIVPAQEGVRQALERETREEAGLRLAQLPDLRRGGVVGETRSCPGRLAHAYIVQDLEWFTCVLPEDVRPRNQDGEVAEFRAMEPAEVARRMEAGEFAPDAALLLLTAFGNG